MPKRPLIISMSDQYRMSLRIFLYFKLFLHWYLIEIAFFRIKRVFCPSCYTWFSYFLRGTVLMMIVRHYASGSLRLNKSPLEVLSLGILIGGNHWIAQIVHSGRHKRPSQVVITLCGRRESEVESFRMLFWIRGLETLQTIWLSMCRTSFQYAFVFLVTDVALGLLNQELVHFLYELVLDRCILYVELIVERRHNLLNQASAHFSVNEAHLSWRLHYFLNFW